MSITLDGTNGITTPELSVGSFVFPSVGPLSNRNKIINGAMTIDQRNAGASVAPASQVYTLDRWITDRFGGAATATVQQSAVAPTGFNNSLLYTVGTGEAPAATAYSNVRQYIEGFNVADLGFGTAAAQTVTLSFWVRSSLTGTFGVALNNSSYERGYVASYAINAANTWEYKTVTIAGDTTGTWLKDNGTGIRVIWDLGVGTTYSSAAGSWTGTYAQFGLAGGVKLAATAGATWQITGVQLEAGDTATPFEHRSYGDELALCQRYYEKQYEQSVVPGNNMGNDQKSSFTALAGSSTNRYANSIPFKVAKRASPTLAFWNYTGASGQWMTGAAGQTETATNVVGSIAGENGIGTLWFATSNNWAYGFWTASAEL